MDQENANVLIPFTPVPRHPGEPQITLSAAPPTASGSNVLDLKRHPGFVAVRASVPPLLQHIFLGLVARQRPPLILDALDARCLHGLRIKAHQLQRERRDGTQPAQPLDPGHHVLYPTPLGGRQPAFRPAPLAKSRLPVPCMALPAPSAHRSPLL